jgi:hypothetical protein
VSYTFRYGGSKYKTWTGDRYSQGIVSRRQKSEKVTSRSSRGCFTSRSSRCLWVRSAQWWPGCWCTSSAWHQFVFLSTSIFNFCFVADNHLEWCVLPISVIGGIIVGLMARYGSERVRGHGIPEALEAILFGKRASWNPSWRHSSRSPRHWSSAPAGRLARRGLSS